LIALIDADNVAIAAAFSAEDQPEAIACARAGEMILGILADSSADKYELWLTGPNNFRYNIYPEYKGDRTDKKRPKWEKQVKQYFRDQWNANTTDGIEADDMLGIRLTEEGNNGIMCHLDKDMNSIAGNHFNWELRRKGNVVREKRNYYVTPEEADYFFFYQLLVGDGTDFIKGASGIGPKNAARILQDCYTNAERLAAVQDYFSCEEELDMTAQCIYIWRKREDNWKNILKS
jgi:DNA polymerase-1